MSVIDNYASLAPVIGHKFKNIGFLRCAFTAPGAEADDYEGHRQFAQVGEFLLQFMLAFKVLQTGSTRGTINDLVSSATARNHRAKIARSKGLGPFIKCSPRQTKGPSTSTLSSTISAIVFATYLDSDGDWNAITEVIHCLGMLPSHGLGSNTQPQLEEMIPSSSLTSSGEIVSTTELTDPSFNEWTIPGFWDSPSADEVEEPICTNCIELQLPPSTQALDLSMTQNHTSTISNEMSRDFEIDSSSSSDQYPWSSSFSSHESDGGTGDDLQIRETDTLDLDFGNLDTMHTKVRDDAVHSESTDEIGSPQDGLTNTVTSLTAQQRALTNGRRISIILETAITREIESDQSPPAVASNPGNRSEGGSQLAPKRRSAIKARPAAMKRRDHKHSGARQSRGSGSSVSNLYITHERDKFTVRNLKCPEGYFDSLEGQHRIQDLGLGNSADRIKIMNFVIGGCETFVILKGILHAFRQGAPVQYAEASASLPRVEQLETIRSLTGNEAYNSLLRTFHILNFTTGGLSEVSDKSSNFVVTTKETMAPGSKRKRGNPIINADAAITRGMVKEIYPDLDESSTVYEGLYGEVKALRRQGYRLNKLVESFGRSILGFIPLARVTSTAGQAFESTHHALFHSTDGDFRKMIDLMDDLQGDFLRKLAQAARPIVEGVCLQTIDPSDHFAIEDIQREVIVQYQKGAPELLELFANSTAISPEQA